MTRCNHDRCLSSGLLCVLICVAGVVAGRTVAGDATPRAPIPPPANPPVEVRRTPVRPQAPALVAAPLYSIGDPTDEEQLYVELINRSRADPTEEGVRLTTTTDTNVLGALEAYQVDLALVAAQFQQIAPVPPLSLNPQLIAAARRHSRDMFENEFQGHVGSDGSMAGARLQDAGYTWTAVGENVFSDAIDVWYGHVAFNLDWGPGPGGIQTPPGHRIAIHNATFREIGVGVVLGTKGDVGPQVVTQELASRSGLTPFVTGVVYYDFNGNQFYDLGEGIGGVTVRVSGTPTEAITSRSGGYSIPVAGNGSYTVTFAVPGLAPVQRPVVVQENANVKVDHAPPYSAPVLGGSSIAFVGRDNAYFFSSVGAATAYQWRSVRRIPWSLPEGAESGTRRFVATVSPGYEPIAADVRHAGSASFHLAHPQPVQDQQLSLRNAIRLGVASTLTFWSRLGVATEDQVAVVEISASGAEWQELWRQRGNGPPGEQGFTQQTVSLAGFAGQTVRLRFAFTFAGGNFYPQTTEGIGWYLDEILVSDSEELEEGEPMPVLVPESNSFPYRPASTGLYLLQVRPLIGDRILSWGPGLALTAQDGGPPPLAIRIEGLSRAGDGEWSLDIQTEGSITAMAIESAASVDGEWVLVPDAQFQPNGRPGGFTVRLTSGSSAGFFRVTGS